MSVKYKLVQDNRSNSNHHGEWYARAVVTDVVTTDELAEAIERTCTVTKSDIVAVLNSLSEVMHDELLDGKRVVLDGIGSFKVGMKTAPAANPADWSPSTHLKGYHIVFKPETTDNVSNGKRTRNVDALQGIKFEELRVYAGAPEQDDDSGQ